MRDPAPYSDTLGMLDGPVLIPLAMNRKHRTTDRFQGFVQGLVREVR
jgi:hypothetical protein